MRATIQFEDSTVENPTPTGPRWVVEVKEDGREVADMLTLMRLQRGETAPRYTEDVRRQFVESVGYDDFDAPEDEARLTAGLRVLFPGLEIEVLPLSPAPEDDSYNLNRCGGRLR